MRVGLVKNLKGWRAGLVLAWMAALFCVPLSGAGGLKDKKQPQQPEPEKRPWMLASERPEMTVGVEPLGFYPPGAYFQGQRQSLVSLDFLDENRLLFSFRAPGLIHRSSNSDGEERQVRAVVLDLPSGRVESEAVWTLHDHARYLWMLKDGHFLLRDENDLKVGDASLELKPLLHFPGPLLWMEMDPEQQYLVTDSHEPPSPTNEATGAGKQPEEANAPAESGAPEIVLRVLQRASGQVILVSRVHNPVYLPINAAGYVETRQANLRQWRLDLNQFAGGTQPMGRVDSTCDPRIDFVTQKRLVAMACNPDGTRRIVAMGTDGRRLWEAPTAPNQVWPILVMSPEGSRMARETLFVTHPIDAFSPLSFEDVLGQVVEVYDTSTGKVVARVPASPVLDGGGNVAISPSGKRLAVLDAGLIQVYDVSGSGTAPPVAAH
jgi:hypothetical protein